MSVTEPRGFRAGGIASGIKAAGKLDLALVVNEGDAPASAVVFTTNRAQAAPIRWSRHVAASGVPVRAVLLNSGGANCFTGAYGEETVRLSAEAVAAALGSEFAPVESGQILVCSTGLIGAGGPEFRAPLLAGVPVLCAGLGDDSAAASRAATAILTTDSQTKSAAVQGDGWRIGAIAKGAGMLSPGLATMLVVITTDALLSDDALQSALEDAVRVSFNRLDSDGCMSTNDQVTLLSSGASGIEPSAAEFGAALGAVCDSLAEQLQADAEGAHHDIDIEVRGAASEADAEEVGRAVARNNLFKAAIFGADPNWGRVLAAIGVTSADFDPYQVDVSFNGVRLCAAGGPDRPREECDLSPRRTRVRIDLHAGTHEATIRTNDLTTDYVRENSAYAS